MINEANIKTLEAVLETVIEPFVGKFKYDEILHAVGLVFVKWQNKTSDCISTSVASAAFDSAWKAAEAGPTFYIKACDYVGLNDEDPTPCKLGKEHSGAHDCISIDTETINEKAPLCIGCAKPMTGFHDGPTLCAICAIESNSAKPKENLKVELNFEAYFNKFFDLIRKEAEESHVNHKLTFDPPTFGVTKGSRYWKIWRKSGSQRSAHTFVDTTNGDILKPASWKAPAKHPRGNIFNPDPMEHMTPYGPAYLK